MIAKSANLDRAALALDGAYVAISLTQASFRYLVLGPLFVLIGVFTQPSIEGAVVAGIASAFAIFTVLLPLSAIGLMNRGLLIANAILAWFLFVAVWGYALIQMTNPTFRDLRARPQTS